MQDGMETNSSLEGTESMASIDNNMFGGLNDNGQIWLWDMDPTNYSI
jgi:hypothetical protein